MNYYRLILGTRKQYLSRRGLRYLQLRHFIGWETRHVETEIDLVHQNAQNCMTYQDYG